MREHLISPFPTRAGLLGGSVSWGCCSSDHGWVAANNSFSLLVLEARSPRSRCQQGLAPSEGSGGGSFLAPPSFRWPLCSWACGHIAPVSASSHVTLCPLLIRTPVTGVRATLTQDYPVSRPFMNNICKDLNPVSPRPEVPGGRDFGGTSLSPSHSALRVRATTSSMNCTSGEERTVLNVG